MHRAITITISAVEGPEGSSRSYTVEGHNLDELMANAHAKLDGAIKDVQSATHHKTMDSASIGEPFSGISIDEQRRRRDEETNRGLTRDRALKVQAHGGRGRLPKGNTGAP